MMLSRNQLARCAGEEDKRNAQFNQPVRHRVTGVAVELVIENREIETISLQGEQGIAVAADTDVFGFCRFEDALDVERDQKLIFNDKNTLAGQETGVD